MTSRREALLERFRANARERLAGARERCQASEALALELLRADLHTLKGETRMLGLVSLSRLVHAIEDWLESAAVDDPPARARLLAALSLVDELIAAPLVEDDHAKQGLARGEQLLAGLEPVPASPRAPAEPTRESSLARVDAATLDRLCERLEQLRAAIGAAHATVSASATRSISLARLDELRLELGEVSELAWSLRLVALEPELRRVGDHAEALARQLGKHVRVVIDAGNAQLERSLVERLHEPILHLVNNAIDHGVEPPQARGDKPREATLTLVARSLGRELELVIQDDGRGIDLERVRTRARERGLVPPALATTLPRSELLELLFTPGFSTATQVGELSGRGVGLGVVRHVVQSLGGSVELDAAEGLGTRFRVRVPATLSREAVIVVELGDILWGLPSRRIGPIVAIERDALVRDGSMTTLLVEGERIPLLSLARLLGLPAAADERVALCCSRGQQRYALASPAVFGELELFRHPLGPTLASISPAGASAQTDQGRLVLLVEPRALLEGRRMHDAGVAVSPRPRARSRVLVVDDSAIVRELIAELLAAGGLEVELAEHGEAALERLATQPFDLVVSDIEMPRLDGFGLLAAIRSRHGSLPVVMASTRSEPEDRRRASELGADAYIVKSAFTDQSLLDVVTSVLRKTP